MRRETRRLGNEKFENLRGEADVIFTGIERFKLTYWDAKNQEWKDSWNTQAAEGAANRLPDKIKIVLTFVDENGKDVALTTETRIFMQETLASYVN